MRWLLALAAAVALGLSAMADDDGVRPLELHATTMPFSVEKDGPASVGRLIHRGTLKLTSDDADFGGLSGLIVSDDGERFLAITDTSHWLTGRLSYRNGKLAGVTGTEIGPLLAPDGHALSGKEGDAEGLTGSLDSDVFVSFERDHRIWRYPFGAEGLAAKPSVVRTPAALRQAPENKGLEGIAQLADGRLLALSEAFHDGDGNIRGWLLKEGEDAAAITLKRRAPFDLTDVRQLPDGDVLTLERRFNPLGGIGFEMRRIKGADVAADALIDGEVVANVSMAFVIDNMEGFSVRRNEEDKTLVYVVSDDNFNPPLQQTLLMLFELED